MSARLLVGLLVMCVVCSGCGKKMSEKAMEKIIEKGMEKDGVKADVNLGNETMTIKTKDGTMSIASGKSAKVPDSFPKDVLVYAGATVLAAVTVPEGVNLSLETPDSVDKVVSAYKSKMTGDGWSEESTFTAGDQSMMAYKKDNRTASVIIMKSDDKTQITLTVVTEK
jgi:hypothetical protein